MDSLTNITKEDASLFNCPEKIHLNEEYKYFVFDQSNLLICSVTAAITLIEYLRQKEGKTYEKFSVGFLYHSVLLTGKDSKTVQTLGMKATTVLYAILNHGSCLNYKWDNLDPFSKPSNEAIIDALSRIKHTKVENIEPCIETVRYILGFCGRPIVATLNIYNKKEFFNKSTSYNVIHSPSSFSSSTGSAASVSSATYVIEDRHSIVLVGYDDNEQCLFFQNSYGTEWGLNGFGRISYDYIPFFGILYSMDESCVKCDLSDLEVDDDDT